GFAIRGVTIDNYKSNHHIRFFNAKRVRFRDMELPAGGVRLSGKVEDMTVEDCRITGGGTTGNSDTCIYLYANAALANVRFNRVRGYNVNSLAYAEAGAAVNGVFAISDYETSGTTPSYLINS